MSSSLNHAALEKLRDLPAGDRAALAVQCPSLRACLERVPGPRDPRGVRHTLTSLLLAAAAAVLAGARSFTATGEWAADAPARVLTSLGIRRDPLGGRFEPPGEATIRRSWNGWMPLPWHQVPVIYDSREKGHGRAEWRTLKTAAVAAGLAFPHAAQAIQIRRRRRPLNGTSRWSTKTTYAITSLTASQATPA